MPTLGEKDLKILTIGLGAWHQICQKGHTFLFQCFIILMLIQEL
jgi:hypothetical protein